MLKSHSLRLRGGRAYEDIHLTCTIQFLDDSDSLSVTYQRDTKGQFIVDYACQHLDLVEKDYFGLYHNDAEKQRTWLDPHKSVQRQLKGIHSPVLLFGVKFYPSDPSKLKEEITRYQLFLQLRKDLQCGALLSTTDEAINLSAYIIQAELGDYDSEEHLPDYISALKNLPTQTYEHEKSLMELHKTLAGQVPAEAEANFLKAASELGAYGMIPFSVTDTKGNNMHLGIAHQGIATFQNNKKTHMFKWSQIRRFSIDGRMFIIRLFNVDSEDSALLIKRSAHSCGFKCSSVAASRNLWKCAVEQQYFFTLQRAADAPKAATSGGLFHRGSKYRFIGRCEKEVYTSVADITRDEPRFQRSRSNAELAQTYSNLRSSTLPASWRQQQKQQGAPLSSTVVGEHQHVAVLETSLDESLCYSTIGGPTFVDEVLNSTAISEETNLFTEDNDNNEQEEQCVQEEVIVQKVANFCGVRDDVIPVMQTFDGAVQNFDQVCVSMNGDNQQVTYERRELLLPDYSSVSHMTMPTPPPSLSPPFTFLTSELDAQIADLRTRLEQDLLTRRQSDLMDEEGVEDDDDDEEGSEFTLGTHVEDPFTEGTLTPATTVVTSGLIQQQEKEIKALSTSLDGAPPVQRRRRWWLPSWRLILALLILILLVVAVMVLEIRADFPVITEIRLMPEVEQFRVDQYVPFRRAIDGYIAEYLG